MSFITGRTSKILGFPHPVNEIAARLVAGMVATVCITFLISDERWLMPSLTYGFFARIISGPNLSPIGLIATRVLIPLMGNPNRPVAGPPKRFAQSIGFCFSMSATILAYGFDMSTVAEILIGVLTVFAVLEAVLGFCAGCFVFGYLIRWRLIPAETCRKCDDFGFG
jgi:hypothetical protein